jgi:Lon protease-like protein
VSALPLFPLGTVLFPGGALALRVFEPRYMDMVSGCLQHQRPFGVCLIREGSEVGAPAVPHTIGCTARIADWDMQQLGVLNLHARGEERFRIVRSRATSQGLVLADIETLAPESDRPVPQGFADCVELLKEAVEASGATAIPEPHRFDSASWVGYRLSEILPLPLAVKQQLLQLEDALARLALLQRVAVPLRKQP